MQSVYIETTIPSYYTGRRPRDLVLAARQQLTIEWWDQCRAEYELFSSQVVLDEARRGDLKAAAKREEFLMGIPLLDISERVAPRRNLSGMMAMKTTTRTHQDSIVLEVRRLKEENAAEYGFNARAIGAAARLHQQDHPERIVSREHPTA